MSDDRNSAGLKSQGIVRGAVGCFITLGSTVVGAIVGGILGWQHFVADAPAGSGSEWHGFGQLVNHVVESGTGVIVGGTAVLILGVVSSIFLLRRRQDFRQNEITD